MARIVTYCQSLQGVGHYVRTRAIAGGLAMAGHQVWLVNGGRHVAASALEPSLKLVQLPLLRKVHGQLVAAEPSSVAGKEPEGPVDLAALLNQRQQLMETLIQKVRPHALLIEHFPFGKHDFAEEILGVIAKARHHRPEVEVMASVRDLPISKELTELSPQQRQTRILQLLGQSFDRLLVHSDPSVASPQDCFPWFRDVPLPVHFTGYVAPAPSRKPGSHHSGELQTPSATTCPSVVVSSGGLGDRGNLSQCCRQAWQMLLEYPDRPLERMQIFSALGDNASDPAGSDPPGLERHPFAADFLDHLANASLSISQGGYNTTVALLQLGLPHILVPSPLVEDQRQRAERLAKLGSSMVLNPQDLGPERLAKAIRECLSRRWQRLFINFDGVETTARIVEAVVTR